MSIVEGTSSSAGQNGGSVLTISGHVVDVGTNRLLLVFVAWKNDDSLSVSTVAWDAAGVNEALTFLGTAQNGTINRTEIWYRKAPTEKTAIVTITLSGTHTDPDNGFAGAAVSLTGVEQGATTFNTFKANTGAGATYTTGAIVSAFQEVVFGDIVIESKDTTQIVVDAPATEVIEETAGAATPTEIGLSVVKIIGAAPDVTVNWTVDGGGKDWSSASVSLRPFTVPGPFLIANKTLGPPNI